MNSTAESLNHKSLNWTLTTSVVMAVVAAMMIYTLFEVLTAGSISASEIMTHHVIPTLVIGVIIWVVLTMLLRSKVIDPIENIIQHLGHVANERLAEIECPRFSRKTKLAFTSEGK